MIGIFSLMRADQKEERKMIERAGDKCALCGARIVAGTTTFAVDYREGLLVARHVPAEICEQCGEAWISDETARHLDTYLREAKASRRPLEIIDMAA